jgi:citrate lyase subunit beta/citryl-CoA lyase
MLEKAAALAPDQVVVDLEDAVPPAEKTDATRAQVAAALAEAAWAAPARSVRVNGVDSPWFRDDVVQIVRGAAGRLHTIVLPKVESADELAAAGLLLDELEAELGLGPIGLEAQIESARGLLHVDRIAGGSPRLEALIFGPGDLAASLGIPQREIGAIDPDYPGDQWHYARSRIAVAAHGNGIDPVDGPFAAFRDLEGFAETARRARLLGFVGKWVIHPGQIEASNRAFSPSAAEIAAARRLIGALDDAARDGRAALELDGAMIDEASRRLAEAVLARASGAER